MEDFCVASVCSHGYTSDKSKHIQTSYFINNPTQEKKRLFRAHNAHVLEHENYIKPITKTIHVIQIALHRALHHNSDISEDLQHPWEELR